MKSAEIRSRFLAYFEARGHTVVPSASLVPVGDPTLLFTNAGMVPFKDVFLGKERRSYTRATSCQKCLRVSGKHNDLEEVGPSPWHDTFFEMLGNFSFGDYFKREAIAFAWEFLTKELGLVSGRLLPTVFEEDDEAAQLWAKVKGMPADKVTRLGESENFWSMGDTGPCGPCSEIHYDLSGKCLQTGGDCMPACECGRWLEVWNLVFMQYDRAPDGTLTPLAKPSIDTGMGLERISAAVQGVSSIYATDLFAPLIERVRALTGDAAPIAPERLPAYRAIADHARAVAFLIADGIVASNEGRGYVLRRILRRASYQGHLLGLDRPFLTEVCREATEMMGAFYPELDEASSRIIELVANEEARFLDTLEAGLNRLEQAIEAASAGATLLSGEEAFRLYDTYGFPIDLTRKVLEARGWSVDEKGFDLAMEAQRERARAARGETRAAEELLASLVRALPPTRFVGYETLASEAQLLALVTSAGRAPEAAEGADVELIFDVTPFYAEGGGQVGDQGRIVGPEGEVEIESVRRVGHGVFAHQGQVARGRIAEGERVRAEVDEEARRATMRNHTATHLLHKALRLVLGPQAKQAGSLVAPDRLRFDFFHNKPLSEDELREVERIVREQVLRNRPVRADVLPLDRALALGADAMFNEKYGEEARVVTIDGAEVFSRELCGGTHCRATGEIGAFFIVDQRSVGAGVRRVEAVTGLNAYQWADLRRWVVDELSREYNVPPPELPDRLRALQQRAREAPKPPSAALPDPSEVLARAEQRDGTVYVIDKVEAPDAAVLREFGDELRRRAKSAAVVLGSVVEGKPTLVVMLTPDRVQAGLDAGKLAREIGQALGAGGGGRPDVATAGGRDPALLDAALDKARELLRR